MQFELLAQAWNQCPQACGECDINRRGCIGFSPAFMGALKALGHCGYLAGVVLYNARCVCLQCSSIRLHASNWRTSSDCDL
jgi:hypothetical protein|eukprot:COSAG02_NODE_900_length_16073_cov_87.296607_11_plen_81_part_00